MDQPDRGYFAFDVKKELVYRALVEKGCVGDVVRPIPLDADGLLPLNIHTFDIDTFILEDSQIKRVDLLDVEKRPYLSLTFTAPVVGLWSPPTKNAPFVCIEPWYGVATGWIIRVSIKTGIGHGIWNRERSSMPPIR